ncbi:MAG: hypothetical protein QME40_03530 [bacterium]|nr:hypothetical protein [bacterium]
MGLEEEWNRAVRETKIIRSYLSTLLSFKDTELPYTFLAKSKVNVGDTVVRKGKVLAHKPLLILPPNYPQFEGFEFEKDYQVNPDTIRSFLLMRGVSFPSLKYSNETCSLDIFEGSLTKATDYFSLELEKKEDVHSGLIVGPEDCWQFSILIYVANLMVKSAPNDIRKILEDFWKKNH